MSALRLASAGAAVVGASFGMARYGYGLLLPDMRAAFGLATGTLGVIAAGSYLAYLLATLAAGAFAARLGTRTVVLTGGACAAAGMLLIAVASGPAALAAGVLVAGVSSGLVFPPFADAVALEVAPPQRARVLAVISSGTGYGVALAAPVAIVAGAAWRAVLVVVGVASLLGGGAAELMRRAGARSAFAGVALALGASLGLLALAPASLGLALVSAVLFGAAYNLLLAMQGIWSSRVFAERPSTGLAAVMFTLGCGLPLGPLIAGPLADRTGLQPLLLSAAALLAATGVLGPRERLVEA